MSKTRLRSLVFRGFQAIAMAVFFLFMNQAATARAQIGQNTLPTRHVRPVVKDGEARPLGALPGKQVMQLSIMLPLRNQPQLTTLLHQVYDPSSPKFRHFLSVTQFTDQFGPTASDYQTVTQWAQSKGFTVGKPSANRMLVHITGTVDQVNRAFHVTMQTYQHPTENRTFFSPDREPTVDVGVPLWHIAGMDNYSIPHPMVSMANSSPTPSVFGSGPGLSSYLPSDMRAAYYGGSALTGAGQSVGLLELSGYNINDVVNTLIGQNADGSTDQYGGTARVIDIGNNNYRIDYMPYGSNQTYSVAINNIFFGNATMTPSTAGGCIQNSVNNCAGEVALDIAQIIGMAPAINQITVYIVPPVSSSDSFDGSAFLSMASDDTANQLSCSWNWSPADISTLAPIFLELKAQGQTLFVASGDDGPWPNSNGNYYPAESAGVISVGATALSTSGPGGLWTGESPWPDSSGGVSPDGIPIPPYQQLAGFSCSGCSATYRNAPDVAMEGAYDNYVCSLGNCSGGWGGTSFAAPRWAGFMALMNQQAQANGNGPVGFINRYIYPIGLISSYTQDFHAVDGGYNLATGWGSPNGQSMINALVYLSQFAPAPQYNSSINYSDFSCGNQDAGYNNPCYETLAITFTVENGESLFVNGQQVGLYNNSYTYSQTEYWGSGQCNSYIGQCFGFAPFTLPVTAYATKPGYANSTVVDIYN